MPSGCQPAEYLMEMRLGSPRLGVQPVQPVDNEDLQKLTPGFGYSRRSGRLKRASSTPFTNLGESFPPYASARWIPSWMETLGGISSKNSNSVAARRRIERSITESRSSRQFSRQDCNILSTSMK